MLIMVPLGLCQSLGFTHHLYALRHAKIIVQTINEIYTANLVYLSSYIVRIVLFEYANETVDSIEFHPVPNQKVNALG
jgi:hypothetical protein